ncbi:MAG TPA: NYN domain-containing protein [Blastocatellia bacterium]|jgi:predicted RNA-binding protein with PIN domain
MAYIVDGNNVMGQTPGWHRDKAKARRRLLEQLADFARVKKARVTVVFDGEPGMGAPDGSAFRGVKVFYADRGSDADTRIERLVESSLNRRGITVVTSDRRLASSVRSSGATVIRSGEFRKQVEHAIASASEEENGKQEQVDDVDVWLRYFGATDEDSDK